LLPLLIPKADCGSIVPEHGPASAGGAIPPSSSQQCVLRCHERDARPYFARPSPQSLIAMRSTMRKPDGELLASNGETHRDRSFTGSISATRDPHPREAQTKHNLFLASVQENAVSRNTGEWITERLCCSRQSVTMHQTARARRATAILQNALRICQIWHADQLRMRSNRAAIASLEMMRSTSARSPTWIDQLFVV